MRPVSGVGLGLRWALVENLRDAPPADLDWIEVAPENYMRRGGMFPSALTSCADRWPIVAHGLTLSLGGTDPLDDRYLHTLRHFLRAIESPWHSDHLCFGSVDGVALHDLLPLPFTDSCARHVAQRVASVQDFLGIPLAVENISSYAHPGAAEMDEAEFVTRVVELSGCKLMLDVNNLYVNAQNHGFDARSMLARMPLKSVLQMHVAGHDDSDPRVIVDTHAEPVRDEVYDLLAFALSKTGPVPVLLERDGNFPPWAETCEEIGRVAAIVRAAAQATLPPAPAAVHHAC